MAMPLQVLRRLALRTCHRRTFDCLSLRLSPTIVSERHHQVKQIRTAALSRHKAPEFFMPKGLEVIQLRRLDDFAFRLFIELVGMADFATGRIATTYAVLIALLDFDQAPKAHAKPKPSKQRIRTALQALSELHLIKDMDPQRNERAGGLFFRVDPRGRISAVNVMSNTMSNTVKKPAKRATARVPASRPLDEQPDQHTRVQERDLSPLPSFLSTAAQPSRTVLAMRAKLRPRGSP